MLSCLVRIKLFSNECMFIAMGSMYIESLRYRTYSCLDKSSPQVYADNSINKLMIMAVDIKRKT